MTIEGLQAEIAELAAEDEKTRRPYLAVTYEASGCWMILGSLDECLEDPSELGTVVVGRELRRFAASRSVSVVTFPGW